MLLLRTIALCTNMCSFCVIYAWNKCFARSTNAGRDLFNPPGNLLNPPGTYSLHRNNPNLEEREHLVTAISAPEMPTQTYSISPETYPIPWKLKYPGNLPNPPETYSIPRKPTESPGNPLRKPINLPETYSIPRKLFLPGNLFNLPETYSISRKPLYVVYQSLQVKPYCSIS